MKALLTITILFFVTTISFSQENNCQRTEVTIGIQSFNSTPILNNPEGLEQTNSNIQYPFFRILYTPKNSDVSVGLKGFGLFDNQSNGGGIALTLATKFMRIDLGGGISSYRKDAEYRDEDAKDQEKFWFGDFWAGTKRFEFFARAYGNTNSMRGVEATAVYYPVNFWGIGARLEKNYPRRMNLLGYTEVSIHKFPGLTGVTLSLYAAAGGYGVGDGKTAFTGSFGLSFSWTGTISFGK